MCFPPLTGAKDLLPTGGVENCTLFMEAVRGLLETYVSSFRRPARPPVGQEPIYLSVSGADVGSRRRSHNLTGPTEMENMVL